MALHDDKARPRDATVAADVGRSAPGTLRELSYHTKLVLAICTLVFLTGVAVTAIAHRNARSATTTLADALFREVSSHAVTRTSNFVLRALPIIDSLAQLSGNGLALDDTDQLARQLLGVLAANPGLSWK